LTQNQLLIPSLQVAFAMCNEFSEEEEDDDDDDDDGMYLPAHEFGAQMIDHFSLTLSAKKVHPCLRFFFFRWSLAHTPNVVRSFLPRSSRRASNS
jgi:hypothetical protein